MKVDNIKQLKALVRMCRDEGVNMIRIDGIELSLEGTPKEPKLGKPQPNLGELSMNAFDPGRIATPDMPTEEQLLFGSSDPTVWKEQQ